MKLTVNIFSEYTFYFWGVVSDYSCLAFGKYGMSGSVFSTWIPTWQLVLPCSSTYMTADFAMKHKVYWKTI